ncbi:hypothetical protein [Paraburkholderia kururiensis]|uniref:hypothetical protein n=1 Tax=Paraburkholderia kururiensis TaxID=984307 RepID=UPI000349C88B|nr:hypothetical protein [Paraburkholderia kururiensis]
MSRARTIRQSSSGLSDPVRDAAKKAAWVCVLFPLLAAGVSYAAYADDLAVSEWPWRIAVVVMVVSLAALGVLLTRARGSNLLWVFGLTQCIGFFVLYFFFGVFGYFFLFLFAPLPSQVRWPGLLGGIAITAYWLYMSRKNVLRVVEHTAFIGKAFEEQAAEFQYGMEAGMQQFERLSTEKSPFPRLFALVVACIAPFYLIVQRVLTASFGTPGVLFFLAVMGMPVSLWFAGLLVRIYIIMVALPARLRREHNKPVVVAR